MSIAKDFLLIPFSLSLIILLVIADSKICLMLAVITGSFLALKFMKKYFNLKTKLIRQREYFINVLSHDFRVSTLAQLRGVEILSKFTSNNDQKLLLSDIDESCRYTLDMISMLLNSFRYENGEKVLVCEEINIENLILNCINQIKKYSYEKNIEIIFKKENTIDSFWADKTEIKKVITNLLITALSNSKSFKKVIINTGYINGMTLFSISYTGKALTLEEYRRMFSGDSKFSTVGHGIRMNLCKQIIEFHGGEIKVINSGNEINTFTFTIPVRAKESPSMLSYTQISQPSV